MDKITDCICYRQHHTGKIDFFHQIFLLDDGCSAAGNTAVKKEPGHKRNEQEDVELINPGSHKNRENNGIDDQLEQRNQKTPKKAKNGAFIFAS